MADYTRAKLPTLAGLGQETIQASPFQFYLTGAENLRITSFNTMAGARIVVQARIFTRDAAPTWHRFDHQPNTNRSAHSTNHPLGECTMANLVVFVEGATPVLGQTFVQVKVIGGDAGAAIVLGTLVQGYVTSSQELSWPGSPLASSLSGGGYTRFLLAGAAAPGANQIVTVPTGARWEITSVLDEFTAGAAAGNRLGRLWFFDGVNGYFSSANPRTIGAGTSGRWQWAQGLGAETTPDTQLPIAGVPRNFPLLAGQAVLVIADAMAAADQHTQTYVVVREWLEVP